MNLPDFDAVGFEFDASNVYLSSGGALLLRQAFTFDPGWLERFQKAYLKMDQLYFTGQMPLAVYEQFYRYGHVLCELIENYSAWLDILLKAPCIQSLLNAIFGSQAFLLLNNSSPRRQGPDHLDHAIPFHQDCEFIGHLQKAINLWVPLTPSGGDYPGLELYLNGPQYPVFTLQQTPDIRQNLSAQIRPEHLWRPQMQPGDILLFSPYTIHRTYLPEACCQTRFSSEIRLVSTLDAAVIKSPMIVCEFGKEL